MAEPLKNSYGPEIVAAIADMILPVFPSFEREAFVEFALEGYDDLELTPRAKQIASSLGCFLPKDRERALEILIDSLGPESGEAKLTGLASFLYMPHVYFVAEHGIEHFEASMRAQYEITKRFTAEFSLRMFIDRYPHESLALLEEWTRDPNVHVRRLVSEGTRSRLPWAPRLRRFQEDPSPVIELLERLWEDPEEYVRRSVANNLNDISKDQPRVVTDLMATWWPKADKNGKRLIRHALRTLIKAGDPRALEVLGFGSGSPVVLKGVRCEPAVAEIGGRLRIEVDVYNPSQEHVGVLIDLQVGFIKADGESRPKVFKGAELSLGPGESRALGKTISLAQHSTRKHYPGRHEVMVLRNGTLLPGCAFELLSPTAG